MSNVTSFLTPTKVVEYLESEIERCLRQKGISKLSAYAFYFDEDNGEEKVNPDYTGIANFPMMMGQWFYFWGRGQCLKFEPIY